MRRSTTIGDVIGGDSPEQRERIRAFVESMPSTRVAISIKTRYHANRNHRWTMNDIHDIDALSVAVTYCDAVLRTRRRGTL
jgi:predicted RNase H-like nuclease (RuvC/YqgF family)